MADHQMSKITSGMIRPPVNTVTGEISTLHDKDRPQHQSTMQDRYNEDALAVYQPEPKGFTKLTDAERTPGLYPFEMDRDELTEQFYKKLIDIQNEHQETLQLIQKLHSEADTRCYQANKYPERMLDSETVPTVAGNEYRYTPKSKTSEGIFLTEDDSEDEEKQDELKDESSENDEYEDFEIAPRDLSSSVSQHRRTEKVTRMWDDFNLKDYLPPETVLKVEEEKVKVSRPKSAPVKKKVWSPVITIPKPFNMTIREETKKEKSHSRSSEAVAKDARERLEQEELEIRMRIRPKEPPAHTYLPLYQEIMERQEQRSRMNREHAERTLQAVVKPFSFMERERVKQKEKDRAKAVERHKVRKNIKSMSHFVARPVPASVHDPTISDKMKEEELYRKIKKKLRSEDIMRESALPPRMQSHEMLYAERRKKRRNQIKKENKLSFRPQTHDMPDFMVLHHREDMEKFARKTNIQTTMTEPFQLRTASLKKKKDAMTHAQRKVLDEEENYRNSLKSLRSSKQYTAPSDTIPTRMTESARLRLEETRRAIAQAEQELVELKLKERARKERRKQMAQEVAARTMAADTELVTPSDYRREKLKQYQMQQRARDNEYQKELRDMNSRLKQRPLLFELQTQKSARDKAEKRYKDILRNSGLSDDMFGEVSSPSPRTKTRSIDDYSDEEFEASVNKSSQSMKHDGNDTDSEVEEEIISADDRYESSNNSRTSVKKQLSFDIE